MKILINQIIDSRLLRIIRCGFIRLSSLMIVMSFLTLIINFPVESVKDFFKVSLGIVYVTIIPMIINAFYNYIALFIVISISYEACIQYTLEKINGMVLTLLSYLALCPVTLFDQTEMIDVKYLSSNNIFLAMIVAILIPFLLHKINSLNLRIKMIPQIPDDVIRSFEVLIPDMILIIFILMIRFVSDGIFKITIPELIQCMITLPLKNLGGHLISLVIVNMGISLFWFFGFNGTYIFNSVMTPVLMTFSLENLLAINQGKMPPHIITQSFQSQYTHLGGCGSTMALIIALFICQDHGNKQIAKISLVPAIFNINEPLVYGLPIILNMKLMMPFILCPIVNTIIAYFSMALGLVQLTNGVQLPWTTPILISGYLSSGITGLLLQIGLLIINVLIYLPFVINQDKIA